MHMVGSVCWRQVFLLTIGGNFYSAFERPGIFSDDYAVLSTPLDALHGSFPGGAVIEYDLENGVLAVSGIKTADVTVSYSITATVQVALVKSSAVSPVAPTS
ncbi:hypothetical protein BZP36_18920 [Raoultella terrigena]|nr:hypothetical protein BZP36_18920 [Raoultella terrigena]